MKPVPLTSEQVEDFVNRACREVEQSDSVLLAEDVSEWAVAHRLAVYLEKYFQGYDVDCEYNRMPGRDDKYGAKAPKKLLGNKKIRPDIIIHKRGSNDANLLAIEIKKSENPVGTDVDRASLQAMKDELYYAYGAMVLLGSNEIKVEFV